MVDWFILFSLYLQVMKDAAALHDKKRLFYSTLMNDNLLDCIISKVNVTEISPGVCFINEHLLYTVPFWMLLFYPCYNEPSLPLSAALKCFYLMLHLLSLNSYSVYECCSLVLKSTIVHHLISIMTWNTALIIQHSVTCQLVSY